ncbi:sulfurtransferase [Thalassotalea insulae]|uniref:Sulfurtransferase n=1 Tax=Thalassotalea insulae TaxID=2056778 RepID=A0ABQ6GPZ4_9GAMM|nr:sulfurtransferase [Thalassotalea insulae]GLX78048.1 sulfurtransferase [Thalassotalea insulae]
MDISPLISTESLAAILNQTNLVFLDASMPPVGGMATPEASWPDVAIKGARRFDLERDFSDHNSGLPHTMISEQAFQQAAQALGINKDSQIVVYDDLGLFSAARAWWMFKAMGHQQVAVLDGGLPKWLRENRPIARGEQTLSVNGNFQAKAHLDYFCDVNQVLAATEDKTKAVLDARAAQRFLGQVAEPRPGLRSGHIPNSINLPFTQLLANGQLLTKAELKEAFSLLVNDNQQLIFSCGSGVTACVLALAADIAGYHELTVYDGSWAEWGSDAQLPIG